jgi:hypothetical protein
MMKNPCRRPFVVALMVLLIAVQIGAREKIDLQIVQRIRREGLENSKIADFLVYLCDVSGPRLSESPQ